MRGCHAAGFAWAWCSWRSMATPSSGHGIPKFISSVAIDNRSASCTSSQITRLTGGKQRSHDQRENAGGFGNRGVRQRSGAASTGELAVVGAPDVEVGLGDRMVAVAVGGETDPGLGE